MKRKSQRNKLLYILIVLLILPVANVGAFERMTHKLPAKATSYKFLNTTYKAQWEQGLASWGTCGFSFYYMDNALNSLGTKNIGADDTLGILYRDNINIWGELTKYSAYLNSNTSKLSKPNWARSTTAHEIGHAIGLAHTSDSQTLMCHSRRRDIIYVPQTDEKNGVKAIY